MTAVDERVFERPVSGRRQRDAADWVIVGTGPAGAAVAETLTKAGHDVVMIEEGRWIKKDEFNGRAFDAQKKAYREMGAVAAMGRSVMPVVQGRCVGGGSVINAAIIWRLPPDVLARWRREFDIGDAIDDRELAAAFDTIEHDLNIHPTSDGALGRNHALLKQGADKLGYESRIIPRNERGCEGYAQCLSGCPIGAKQSMDLTYIPASLARGARLYHSAEAGHIDVEAGRARRVHAEFKDPLTRARRGRLTVEARRGVIVCASTVQSPLLLWRSGIGLGSGHLGRHFMAHPGASIAAVFPEEVRIWEGATQGWDSEHFRESDHIKFEGLALPPDLFIGRLPWVGMDLKKALAEYDRMANVGCAMVAQAEGSVRPLGGGPLITFTPTKQDMINLRKGLRILADIMVAAGAVAIVPDIHGVPGRLSRDQLGLIDQASIDPRSYTMAMTHLFGTCRLGTDPQKSVVGPDFQVHDTRGVYVMDSSVFPTNLGVNPQHSIMAVATIAAKRLAG
jgi:choline dehydrogenase-like flavoprotein